MTPAISPPASEQLAGLADRCRAASAEQTASLLIEAFDLTNWRSRPKRQFVHHNPQWAAFDKLIRAGGFLDAALSLVPEGMWRRINIDPNGRANIRLGDACAVTAATPALALCAAALRARAHQETRP